MGGGDWGERGLVVEVGRRSARGLRGQGQCVGHEREAGGILIISEVQGTAGVAPHDGVRDIAGVGTALAAGGGGGSVHGQLLSSTGEA